MIKFKLGLRQQPKTRNRIGLDIGTSAIKVVEASGPVDKPVLTALALANITPSSKSNLTDLIKATVAEARVSTKEANISVSGPSLIVRFISMPKMKAEDLKNAIRFEAEKFIPFDISECVIDFQILTKSDNENRQSILLVAARREQIQDRARAVEQAGLSVGVIDVDGFAIANAFMRNFPSFDPSTNAQGQSRAVRQAHGASNGAEQGRGASEARRGIDANKTAALLNIGASYTNLSILKGGVIHFSRDVAIGSNDFDETIAKIFNISPGAAQTLKVSPKERAARLAESAKQIAAGLLDDVKLSFSYHENQSGQSIDEVYLSGGGAELAGLDDVFSESFGAKPVRWDPLAFLEKSGKGIDPDLLSSSKGFFAVAAGLALR
jgi:type IV pilus assembly protein PilM